MGIGLHYLSGLPRGCGLGPLVMRIGHSGHGAGWRGERHPAPTVCYALMSIIQIETASSRRTTTSDPSCSGVGQEVGAPRPSWIETLTGLWPPARPAYRQVARR